MNTEILGYKIEKAAPGTKKSEWSNEEVAYYLHGKRATYRLIRNGEHTMYAINTNGNICGIKGNYTFSDKYGDLVTMIAGIGAHPDDYKKWEERNAHVFTKIERKEPNAKIELEKNISDRLKSLSGNLQNLTKMQMDYLNQHLKNLGY